MTEQERGNGQRNDSDPTDEQIIVPEVTEIAIPENEIRVPTGMADDEAGKLKDRAGVIFRDRIRYARKHFGLLGSLNARFALTSSGTLEAMGCLFDGEASISRRFKECLRITRMVFNILKVA